MRKVHTSEHFPDEDIDETADKFRDMQEQIDALVAAYEKLEKRVSSLEERVATLDDAQNERLA